MSDQSWRVEWEGQAGDWVELTTDDPFYDLLNEPTFLELVPDPGALTIDVGCGEGRLARVLAERGHRVAAVDGAPSLAARAAHDQRPTAVTVGDITALPVTSGAADLVVCFMVLMDVEDLERGVAELARILAPRGVVCAAILHPIFTSGLFVPGDPNRTFSMGEYRRPMRHVLDMTRPNGETFPFRVEHRPMEDYSRAFEAAGLSITALREPRPSDELVEQRPEFANYQRVPNFLHIRAEHAGSRGLG
ncbi:MAG: class I SAM-dependent methyltransferase [Acidimicrobiia bacterium]